MNSCVIAGRECSYFLLMLHTLYLKTVNLYTEHAWALSNCNIYNNPIRATPNPVNKKSRRCTRLKHYHMSSSIVHNTLYRKRHNAIVGIMCKAATNKWTIMVENQVIGTNILRANLIDRKGRILFSSMLLLPTRMVFKLLKMPAR